MTMPPLEVVDLDPAQDAAWFATVSCLHADRRNVRQVSIEDFLSTVPSHIAATMRRHLPPYRLVWDCGTCWRTVECRNPANPDPYAQRGTLHGFTAPPRHRLSPKARRQIIDDLAEDWGWTCWLCNEPIDPDLRHPDPDAVSIDHIVPLTDGGADDDHNMALTHHGCNLAKHDERDVRDWTVSVTASRRRSRVRAFVEPAIAGLRPELEPAMQHRMRLATGHALDWSWTEELGYGWTDIIIEPTLAYAQARIVAALFRPAKIVLSVREQYAAQAVHRAWNTGDPDARTDDRLMAVARHAHEHWEECQAEDYQAHQHAPPT